MKMTRLREDEQADDHNHGARERKSIADANAEKANAEKEHDELREALNIREEELGTGTRQYASEDGARSARHCEEINGDTGASLRVDEENDTAP